MSNDRPPCDIRACDRPGTEEGYYPRPFGRPGVMCPEHAYDPRNGFMPRPYRVSKHDCHSRAMCVGCFRPVAVPTDHAQGCPTGQNGAPNYN